MNIYILGSGTCIPNKRRGSSGYYLEINDNKILLDCGNGTTWKLEHIGVSFTDIDHIFITHFHPDHTSDLIPFLFANKYPYNRRRDKNLHIWGGKGINNFIESLNSIYNNWLISDNLIVNEINDSKMLFDDFSIEVINSVHTDNSLVYKILSSEHTVVYTGDTDYFEGLEAISRHADLLLIECSSVDDKKINGHLTPLEIIKLARISTPKKIVLTHLCPVCDEFDIVKQIQSEVESEVIKAEDFMKITL